jgi:hypothetical protein
MNSRFPFISAVWAFRKGPLSGSRPRSFRPPDFILRHFFVLNDCRIIVADAGAARHADLTLNAGLLLCCNSIDEKAHKLSQLPRS